MLLRMATRTLVALAFAAVGIFGGAAGCVALLGLGVAALMILQGNRTTELAVARSPHPSQFAPWWVSILFFAGFVVALSPFAELPAVVIALLVLSPLFATLIVLVTAAADHLVARFR